jgi:hypothetical protein
MMAMVAIATAAFAQSSIYVYRNDGNIVTIPDSTIQSMECSKVDSQWVTHNNYVTQIIRTTSNIYAIPLSKINSISFLPISQVVDLGLSVRWASYNVGATKPEEYGGYYGWADPTGTNTSTNVYTSENSPINISGTEYDIARAKWGVNWRLPTDAEVQELFNSCTWTWTTQKGVNGYKVVGKNGNSIFLPAAGNRYGTAMDLVGAYGEYWSGILSDNIYSAIHLSFNSGGYGLATSNCFFGLSVRPVFNSNSISVVTGSAYNITQISVKLTGAVIGTVPHDTISCGMFYSTQSAGVKNGTKVASNLSADGNFSITLNGFIGNTTYYYCAYLMIDDKYYYGEVKSFTTKAYEKSGDAVDLGLSVKWASCNVGATKPEGYGGYYGWADPTGTKTSTNDDDYPSANPPSEISGTEYDIARAKWGGNWRFPTIEEMEELVYNCTWTWTTQNGVNGMKVVGPNGNSIFLPAAGYRGGTGMSYVGTDGGYWSGTLYGCNAYFAYGLGFDNNGNHYVNSYGRTYGITVRPVVK